MKRIALASHVTLIGGKEYDGVGNVLIEELSSITEEFFTIRHSMDGYLPSEARLYKGGRVVRSENMHVIARPAPLRYILEVFKTVRYLSRKEKVNVYIGVDPLNTLSGIILKKFGKVDVVVFYTSDYSPKRFNNNLLDKIYHSVDTYCVKKADEVWSVSTRIVHIRKRMGLADKKNIFVPNVPPVAYNVFRDYNRDKFMLVTTGVIGRQLDYEGAIRAVAKLKYEYPKISLIIIGNGPEEGRLKELTKQLGVEKEIKFTGRLPLSETLKRISGAGVGLALYTGVWGFNYYGDSTKCREYFTYGLPVLSTDTHSTVEEIRESKAGIITELGVDSYVAAIKEILSNYDIYSKRSLTLGEKYKGIHKKELLRILISDD